MEINGEEFRFVDILTIPINRTINKFRLVEELSEEENYAKLCIGNCCVIGKLHQVGGDFELENVCLPQSKPSLVEGTYSVRLLDFDVWSGHGCLRNGSYVEICGEVVLFNGETNDFFSTYELHLRLRRLQTTSAKFDYIQKLRGTYKVAIKVNTFQEIDRASDLAECNYQLRMIR